MYYYAQLNDDKRVIGISQLSGEVKTENLIDITNLEVKPDLGYIYEPVNGTFTESSLEQEPTESLPTLEEQILAENQYQTALLEMQMLGGM